MDNSLEEKYIFPIQELCRKEKDPRRIDKIINDAEYSVRTDKTLSEEEVFELVGVLENMAHDNQGKVFHTVEFDNHPDKEKFENYFLDDTKTHHSSDRLRRELHNQQLKIGRDVDLGEKGVRYNLYLLEEADVVQRIFEGAREEGFLQYEPYTSSDHFSTKEDGLSTNPGHYFVWQEHKPQLQYFIFMLCVENILFCDWNYETVPKTPKPQWNRIGQHFRKPSGSFFTNLRNGYKKIREKPPPKHDQIEKLFM